MGNIGKKVVHKISCSCGWLLGDGGGLRTTNCSFNSRIKRTGHPGPTKASTEEAPQSTKRPASLAGNTCLSHRSSFLTHEPCHDTGIRTSRHFRSLPPVSRDPRPGRSAFENPTPFGSVQLTWRVDSAGGPIASQQRSSSFLATASAMHRILAQLFVIPRGRDAHLSLSVFPVGGRRKEPGRNAGRDRRSGKEAETGKSKPRGAYLGVGPFFPFFCPRLRTSINAGSPHAEKGDQMTIRRNVL